MSCICHNCKKQYTVDLILSDDLWDEIYSSLNPNALSGSGMLCPTCIVSILQLTDEYKAFKLIDVNAYKDKL